MGANEMGLNTLTSIRLNHYALLTALHHAVQAQADEPGGADMLRTEILAALQLLKVAPDSERGFSYIGRHRACGCIQTAQHDRVTPKATMHEVRDVAASVAEMIRAGLIVGRVPSALFVGLERCDQCDPPTLKQEGMGLL